MQKPILIVLLAIAATSISSAQGNTSSVQEELKKLENERNTAITKSDTAALERTTSDDYTLINLSGQLRNKSQLMQSFKTGDIKITSREIDDVNVRVYGNTAVVTGHVTQKGKGEGKDITGQYRFTRVYVKQKGTWQSVAAQETRISP
jgi:ketosteroid isomerase-like protein